MEKDKNSDEKIIPEKTEKTGEDLNKEANNSDKNKEMNKDINNDSEPETEKVEKGITPIVIEDEMKTSYIDYAMSVIVGRALPDVRDGLKPVHRRIMFAMNDMGMHHNKPYKKSARIVGECFVKDTLILTNKGLIPIQEIKRGDIAVTQKGNNKVIELYEMPEKELLKITLKNGISNTVTSSQKFKILNKKLEFEWKEAKQLTVDDYVVVKADYPQIEENVFLGELNNKKIYLNENIAYLLGQLLSDGWVEKGYNHGNGFRCCFSSSSIEIMNKLKKIIENEFDYIANIEEKKYVFKSKKGLIIHNKMYNVRINQVKINEFLTTSFKLNNVNAETKIIPQQIFVSSKKIIISLVNGLIDGDGSIHNKRNVINYSSISEKMIGQIQILLQHLGIFSTKYTADQQLHRIINERKIKSNHKLYSLEMVGLFAFKLSKLLSLSERRKHERINFKQDIKNSKYDIIPYAGKKIFEELSKKHIGSGWYTSQDGKKFRLGIKYPSGCKIRYSKDLIEKDLGRTQICMWNIKTKLSLIESPLSKVINHIIEDNIFFLKVKKIEIVDPDKTYDIEVENAHEFVANGIVSHNCLGKYHPHGDLAVYDSMVRMAQSFSLRYTLIDGHGNWGSIDGDSAAAMRYTECRLQKIAEDILEDIDKETVNFVDNFDGTLKEPVVLPSKVPNLLINGSSGIAVGMATNIPPHNIQEVCSAAINVINNPEMPIKELMGIVKGPDFPTGGIICGKLGISYAYGTGRGKILVKGKTHIEKHKEREAIIIDEIPYMVNKSTLVEEIADNVKSKLIEGISDIRDESDKSGMRVVIELKKDSNTDVVLNQLYKHSKLQNTFGIIMLALVDNEPRILNLKEMLEEFIKHRKIVVTRRTQFELKKAEERAHILEGLKIALSDIDNAIRIIKAAKDVNIARTGLVTTYTLTEIQAQAILDMKLQKLTSLETEKILEELINLIEKIKDFKDILASEIRIKDIIKNELSEISEKYKDERKTEISESDEEEDIEIEDLIEEEDVVVTISHGGYIKRTPLNVYKSQGRGGRGIIAATTKEEDFVEHLFIANTHDYLLFFTDKGQVHWLKVFKIPEGARQAKGKAIVNLINIEAGSEKGSNITAFIPIKQFEATQYLVMVTKNGIIKKTSLAEFSNPRHGGIRAINIEEGDELVNVLLTDGTKQIMIATKDGLAVKFNEEDVREMGRASIGVIGIRLKKDDKVIGAVIGDDNKTLLTITENGYGKRTSISEYRLINRGGQGVINIICSERNGNVVGIKSVSEEDEIMLISQKGIIIRTRCSLISVIGRNTQGVRLMKLEEGDKVVSAAKIIGDEGSE